MDPDTKQVRPKTAAAVPEQKFVNRITWNPWFAVVFIVVVYYVAQILASSIISIYPLVKHWSQIQANDWLQNSVWGNFFYILLAETFTLGAIYGFLRHRKVSLRAIGIRKPKLSDPLWGLSMLPLYYVSYLAAVGVAHRLIPALNVNQSQQIGFNSVAGFGGLFLTFISLVILPPLTEEIMVRGFLYGSLKKGLPQIGAALVTSVIFASAHLQAGSGQPLLWIAAIDTFILSLFLIYLREKTDGLWASMTLHALKNTIAFVSLFIFHVM
jgi:membrane protease YdiL (CAAX protease family)